jgi:hypothetical protein
MTLYNTSIKPSPYTLNGTVTTSKQSILDMLETKYGGGFNNQHTTTNLGYKGITFTVAIDKEILDFFEDPLKISLDEFMLLDVSFPDVAKRIKSAWKSAWTELQAEKEFYKTDEETK